MRRKRKKFTSAKIGLIFIIILFSLASVSISYSHWSQTLQIEGTVTTLDDFNYPYLEGHWRLDNGSGQTAYDSSLNTNDGTLGSTSGPDDNDPTGVIGHSGNALSFDGNDYVRVPDDPSLNIEIGSWGLWLKFDEKPSNVGHLMNPIAKGEQYWIHASSDDSIQAKISVGGTRYIATTGANFIEIDVWYHVFGTYDGETLKLYVNGIEVASNAAPSGNLDTTNNIFAIGTWSSLTDYFHGVIDDVRIYSCVLFS